MTNTKHSRLITALTAAGLLLASLTADAEEPKTGAQPKPPAAQNTNWQESWPAFVGALSRELGAVLTIKELDSKRVNGQGFAWSSPQIENKLNGKIVSWTGVVTSTFQSGGTFYVIRMLPCAVRFKDGFEVTLDSVTVGPSGANAKGWEPVRVGDQVSFRTTLKSNAMFSVVVVMHGVASPFLAKKGGRNGDTVVFLNTEDGQLLSRTPAINRPKDAK